MGNGRRARCQVFVGTSKESRRLAYAIQQNLDDDADITVWDQNVFQLTRSALQSLIDRLAQSDFAIFVFAPDDVVKLRGTNMRAVRDNVVFELGLFMGRLGPDRTFIVAPKGGGKLRIPTDLLGLMIGRFNPKRQDGNLRASMGPFCSDVRDRIEDLGKFGKKRRAPRKSAQGPPKGDLVILEALYGAGDQRINVARKLNSEIRRGKLHVGVGNQLGGDPCPNIKKNIQVKYTYRGKRREITIAEGEDLSLPGAPVQA